MKKFLLFASAALVASSAFASVDAYDYGTKNDLSIYNRWVSARAYNIDDWNAFSFGADYYQYARTATLYIDEAKAENNRVLVSWGPSR